MMALTLGKVADWGIPVARVLLDRVNQTRASLSEQGDLTEGEVSSLGGVGDAAVLAYISGLQQMHDTMLNSLSQYKMPGEFVGAGDRVAEMLHAAFGEDHSILSKAKHASEAFHRAEENLKYVIEWAEQGVKEVRMLDALGIMKARYWPVAESAYKHIIERWGEVLPLVVAIHGAMQAVWDSASAVSAAHDPSQTSTKQAAAGVEAGTSIVTGIAGVAAAVGIEAAGSFGFIWANTIVPQTQKALKALEHLDSIASSGARKDMQVWWHDAAQGGKGPPVIPKAYLAQNWFPGGQATLNYMWAIFRGEPPVRVPAEVTKFFYDARKKMNLEKSEGEQLKTEWHLFEENEVKNLREWVTEHKVEVWGMLYGSLPHP
jgi:hypothetical protein